MSCRPSAQNSLDSLNNAEVNQVIDHIGSDRRDGVISYGEVKQTLSRVHEELFGRPSGHDTVEHDQVSSRFDDLLHQIFPRGEQQISRGDFARWIQQCKIPSLQLANTEETKHQYFETRHRWRRVRAYWTVHGPEILFISLVVSMQAAFAAWQAVNFDKGMYKAAFGTGLVVAKACSGALYPTFFFLLLSTSRYLSTLLRRSHFFSRFLGLDHSRAFHIYISYVALLLSTMHAVGHLAGTFRHGSQPGADGAVSAVVSREKLGGHDYINYIRSVPGYTGITAICILYVMAVFATPAVRKWNYDVFQSSHLLMYPLIILMFIHGSAALLQSPLFGYFLALPVLLVMLERASRVISGFYRIPATLTILDDETIQITVLLPKLRLWDYTAGQYIFLQVPDISFFQWHPFTISFCRGKQLTLHIKTNGDWTSKLRQLPRDIAVGINGPFGAPSQRFYKYDRSLIIGAGIGVTPFSAILADLQDKNDLEHRRSLTQTDGTTDEPHHSTSPATSIKSKRKTKKPPRVSRTRRRTDFHWIVRRGKSLMWLSGLLNRVSLSQQRHGKTGSHLDLDIRTHTYITAKYGRTATYVFSWLLEAGRTQQTPFSPLTGLLNPTSFGRPDFDKILDEHYEEVKRELNREAGMPPQGSKLSEVGVFYCGAAAVGEILADKCAELSIRGQNDGSKIEYHFMKEVFG